MSLSASLSGALSASATQRASVLAAEQQQTNPNPLLPDLAEVVVGGFAFLAVFLVLGKLLVPRIAKALEERTNAIEGGLQRAEEAQAEARRTLEAYRAQLADARHEAARLREEAREQGAAIIAEMREQAQSEAQRIVANANQQIEADRQQALAQLRGEVGAMATDLAGRIVGESLADDARQQRVVDRFLGELEEQAQRDGQRGGPGQPEQVS